MLNLSPFVNASLTDLISKHNVDPYSREFIFGSDERWTRLRNQPIFTGPNGPVTLLNAILRCGLDDTKRANLFIGSYHLGNSKSIPQDRLTLTHLAKDVRKEKHEVVRKRAPRIGPWNDEPTSLKKEFESITDALKDITGKTFSEYQDKQNALRVIYLLDRMMADPRIAPEGRSKRVLTFIKTPTKRFSFEARDAHPTSKSADNTFLLNDLKAYIGIEIADEDKDRIDTVFYSLIDRVEAIRSHLDEAAYWSGSRLRIRDKYRLMHSLVDATDGLPETALYCRSTRLDEDLYLHLSRFEFLHFAGAHSEVLDFARPPSTIVPIKEEIVAALGTLGAKESSYIDITLDSFLLSGIPDLAKENADLFLDLLESSLGFRPNDSNYERSVALASELMYRVRLFSSVAPTPRESVKVSFRNIVTALCATSQALRFPTHYRPRVFGDDSQTRSIITPLECPIELDGVTQPCEFAEGHLQIWHNRREWVQDALEGNNDIAELKFSLRRILWTKVVECVKPNNVDAIAENLSRLEARLLRVRPQALGA